MRARKYVLALLVGWLAGCDAMPSVGPGRQVSIAGTVRGGQQPVSGSTIQLYAVGTAGDGSAATPLLSTAVKTDATGSFSLSGLYACSPPAEDVYLVSTGGNPGLAAGTNNAAIAMMASLGPCSGLGASTFISVNELTTVGSLAALYPYANSYWQVGSGAGDLSQFGAAVGAVSEYTNTASGSVPGLTLPAGYTASSVAITTLGDIISSCVNSAGGVAGDGSACGTLFTLTTPPGGQAATDTVGAVLDVLKNPTSNVAAIYNLLPSKGPFLPTLTGAPVSWALPIVAPAGSPAATPVFSPGGGEYLSAQTVSISAVTASCGGTPTIYYSLNGGAAAVYSGPLQVGVSETVSAYLTGCGGYATSATAKASYSIDLYGVISTIAGTGTAGYSGDGGSGSGAEIDAPFGVAVDGFGNVYFADTFNCRVRVVSAAGIVSTVAGTGVCGYNGDGQLAVNANLYYPYGVAVDAGGNVYISDYGNVLIRKVNAAGVISTVAGTGEPGYSGDGGQATLAAIAYPYGVAVDAAGNLYLCDAGNERIRKVTAGGVISTVAGNGTAGFSGDGGAATSAELSTPAGVAVDGNGNLYIADVLNARIRKVTTAGVISTVAGNGTEGFTGDGGVATGAELSDPNAVAVDGNGNLYIADSGNGRVRKIVAGVISTVAGGGAAGDGGLATGAQVSPFAVAADGVGNFYVADSVAGRIRAVVYQAGHP